MPNGARPAPRKKHSKAYYIFINILRELFRLSDKIKAKDLKHNRKFLVTCGAILVVLIAVPVIIGISVHNHQDVLESQTIQTFYSGNTNKTNVVFSGQKFEDEIVGEIQENATNANGDIRASLTKTGELYYLTTQGCKLISGNVRSFVLSRDGNSLAYVMVEAPETTEETTETTTKASSRKKKSTTPETETTTEYVPAGGGELLTYEDTSLFLYSALTANADFITNHVNPRSVALSADGNAICYTVTAEDAESFEGFVFRDGNFVSTGKNSLPIALSDDATRYYHVKYEPLDDAWIMKFFYKDGEEEIKLVEFSDSNRFIAYVNKACDEIIFGISGQNGSFFYSKGFSEKTKLASGYYPLHPFGIKDTKNNRVTIVPYDTFKKTVFCDSNGTAQYLNKKMECTDTGISGTQFRLSTDEKTVYFMDDKGLLCSDGVSKSNRKEIADHVMTFDLSADGKILYYLNSNNELHAYSGNTDKLIAENVYAQGNGLCVTDGGYLYFLINYSYGSGTLCYVKGTGAAKVLEEYNNVHDIAADTGDCIYYRADFSAVSGAYDLYYGSGKKFACILRELG